MDGRCSILMLIMTCVAQSDCVAQDDRVDAPLAVSRNEFGVLVLVDGRMLTGQFTPRHDGYEVEVAAGRMFIESERVRFLARDIDDAYKTLRNSYGAMTPDAHMQLARWCLTNQLSEQARREVLDALNLDPNRTEAKRMLESLLQSESRSASSQRTGSGLTEYPTLREAVTSKVESRSLAGLSRSVAQDFTRHLQPLLMNKCGNSGCHGGRTTTTFQLTSAHRGSNPSIAEKNLAAVLKQIDLRYPSESPILASLDAAHGGLPTPIFRGRSGAQQLGILKAWVLRAANDIAPGSNEEMSPANSDVTLASASLPVEERHSHVGNEVDRELPHGRKLTNADTDPTFVAEAMRANADDAFAPSEFNKKYHGNKTPLTNPVSKGRPVVPEDEILIIPEE